MLTAKPTTDWRVDREVRLHVERELAAGRTLAEIGADPELAGVDPYWLIADLCCEQEVPDPAMMEPSFARGAPFADLARQSVPVRRSHRPGRRAARLAA